MGKVIMSGIVLPLVAPVTGILASDIAVGSSVYLMENGVATEYLVVNQGIPSASSLYDSSCDGTWLLRKDIYENRAWHSEQLNDYKNSTIHAYLNGTFFNLFGSIEQSTIKQVKIPFVDGTGKNTIGTGQNGLLTKIFLLSGYEVGWTESTSRYFQMDGAKLSYFISGTSSSANKKRVAYKNSTASRWSLRTNKSGSAPYITVVLADGTYEFYSANGSYGVRPALVLPSTAVFDENTLILKGVK